MAFPAARLVTAILAALSFFSSQAQAFDNIRRDNVAVYWGQNSYGASHGADTVNHEKALGFYCNMGVFPKQDDAVDVFPIAFLNIFFGPGGAPSINLSNQCSSSGSTNFPGTGLPDCSALAADIIKCQARGKIVTLSLGGATGSVGFTNDAQAKTFASTVWNTFLGGSSATRPFGSAVLDGIDLDIEGGSPHHYAAFVAEIHALAAKDLTKKHLHSFPNLYYVTATPQCPFPDAALGEVLNTAHFDAVYVQFYNNYCGLQNAQIASDWNYGVWDNWARTTSPNRDVKIYIGAPSAVEVAGSGYATLETLSTVAIQMRNSFPSFGGVMLWDVSQAYQNQRFELGIKKALVAAGGSGFTYPMCTTAYAPGKGYPGGSKVSYGGYIWQAKYYASKTPSNDAGNEWSAISACGEGEVPLPSSAPLTSTRGIVPTASSSPLCTSTLITSTVPMSSRPTTSASATTYSLNIIVSSSAQATATLSATGTGDEGMCAGVLVRDSDRVFVGGQKVIYNGDLWTTSWWTRGDVPGTGEWGPWARTLACSGPVPTSSSAVSSSVVSTSSPVPQSSSSDIPTLPSVSPSFSVVPSTTTVLAPSPTDGPCHGIAPWNAEFVYTGGLQVVFEGELYTAKWWTKGDDPSCDDVPWTLVAACAVISPPVGTVGKCGGVKAWGSGRIYTAGNKAVVGDKLYMAKWWTTGDDPTSGLGEQYGPWAEVGLCKESIFKRGRGSHPMNRRH